MTEYYISDIAILVLDMEHCPVCKANLSSCQVLYRYPSTNGMRTGFIRALQCKDCNQVYGTYALLDKVPAAATYDIHRGQRGCLPHHVFNEAEANDPDKRNYSVVESREFKTPEFPGKNKKKTIAKLTITKEDQRNIAIEAARSVEIKKEKPIVNEIDAAPSPTMGPVAVLPINDKGIEVIEPNTSKEIFDMTILGPTVNYCPICKSNLRQASGSYHYRVNDLEKVYVGILPYCDRCGQFFGSIDWLNQLWKHEQQTDSGTVEVFMKYHYYGETIEPSNSIASAMPELEITTPAIKTKKNAVVKLQTEAPVTFEVKRNELGAPESTIVIIDCVDDESYHMETICIVNDQKAQNGIKRIYFTSSPVGNTVIESVLSNRDSFELNNFQYRILDIYKRHDFDTIVAGRKRILKVFERPSELVDVYVYELKGICRKHGDQTEKLVVNMISSRSESPHPLEVYYCPACGKFYVNHDAYLRFYRKYGIPPLRLYGDSATSGAVGQFSSLRQHSDLNLFGYSVSGELGENRYLRQAILEDVIDSGNLTKAQVTSHLEWLIRFGRNNEKMMYAMKLWQEDLDHIERYQPKLTSIWGQFKPGGTKVFI